MLATPFAIRFLLERVPPRSEAGRKPVIYSQLKKCLTRSRVGDNRWRAVESENVRGIMTFFQDCRYRAKQKELCWRLCNASWLNQEGSDSGSHSLDFSRYCFVGDKSEISTLLLTSCNMTPSSLKGANVSGFIQTAMDTILSLEELGFVALDRDGAVVGIDRIRMYLRRLNQVA